MGVEILPVALCYRNRDKLRPDEPPGSNADFTLIIIYWRAEVYMMSLTINFLLYLLYETDRFHVAVRLFSDRSQRT